MRDELSLVRNQNLHNVTERILIARDANNEVELETFCSENRRVHPMQFLNRVREFDRFNGSSWEVKLIKILKCFKGNSEIWAETHRNEWERYEPVSYTHLDVYKRQTHGAIVSTETGGIRPDDAGRHN